MANLDSNPIQQIQSTPGDDASSRAVQLLTPNKGQPDTGSGGLLDLVQDDEISVFINTILRNDISDKEESGWTEKRIYDINSYEGNKRPVTFPWANACNFPVPLTPTLVDTAHANIMASIFFDPERTVDVQGVGVEDIRKAPILGQLLNWQVNKEIEAYEAWDKAVFMALRDGTAVVKVIQSLFDDKVVLESVPVDNMFLPIDAKGFQIGQTDHCIEIIGLTQNDIEQRKNLKDPTTGQPIYQGLDDLPAGLRLNYSTSLQARTRQMDMISGTKVDDRNTRDLKYIAECYLTYWVKTKDNKESAPIELAVWVSPSSGQVLRKTINQTGKRPYFALIPYPRVDRFFGMSLPEKIRHIQEELDYSHNQNLNAADKAIAQPVFYDPLSGFDPNLNQIVPGGAYPSPGGKAPEVLTFNVNPIFERQEDRYWDLAERLTGLTELFQGRAPSRTKTLGEAKLRDNRTEIRFKALYQRFERGWSEMCDLIYFYDDMYMSKDKKIQILGVNDYKTIDELFPKGMKGNYNFTFRNTPITELESKKQDLQMLMDSLLLSPLVAMDRGNTWRVLNRKAEILGERNLETLVTKPNEANIISPEEAIQRIMSGQYDFQPEPGIDPMNYMLRIQLFMKTDTFMSAPPEAQQAMMILMRRCQMIAMGQMQAQADAAAIHRGPAPVPGLGGPGGPSDGSAPPGGPPAPTSGAPTPQAPGHLPVPQNGLHG